MSTLFPSNHIDEEVIDISQHDLITALTNSLQVAQALIETGMEMDMSEVDPAAAQMFLSALLKLVQASQKISAEIFVDQKMVH
jgi:hypothetical protein